MAAELTREMDLLRDQLEAAFAEVVGQVDQIASRLAAIERAAEAQAEALERPNGSGEDSLALVRDRLSHLDQAVAATHRELVRLQEVPLAVDTRRLEDVASRGSLHNAADIANLRRDIESLTESARSQDRALRELRTTLDWIKDRLLR